VKAEEKVIKETRDVLFNMKNCSFGLFYHLNYKIMKLQRFGSFILLPSSGKKGEI
jgi:hypothetical protein